MVIAGLAKSTLVDFPDHIACVLFMPGCNYDCFYCHNRALIDGSHVRMDMDEVWHFLTKRREQLDGVVLTGGEPTLQKDLMPFIRKIKTLGYKVKLDTNGSRPVIVAQIASERLVDYVAVDYKAPVQRYREFCGENADAQAVLQTIHILQLSGMPFEVRTTVIPQLSMVDLLMMANELPQLPRYVLNRYRVPESFLEKDRGRVLQSMYSQLQIEEMARSLHPIQPNAIG